MTSSAAVHILPEGVRRHLADLAAAVLGELSGPDVPSQLVRVRSFAPARRARAGAGPIGAALDRDPGFRQRVAAAWRALHPELAGAIDTGSVPAAVDPALVLAGVYLLRPPDWEDLVQSLVAAVLRIEEAAAGQQSDAVLRAELKAAQEEADRLRDLLDRERVQAVELEEQLTTLRREVRKLRSDADRARAQARAGAEQAGADRERLEARLREQTALANEAAERLRQATERAEQARRAEREGRSLADSRVRLLLDTVIEAASGLRREIALPPAEIRPADLVTSSPPAPDDALGAAAASARAQDPADPARLSDLLALPVVHLIVDGYNVTKSGYGTLPLVEQRRRLVESLTGLAARTGAEVTCCFDGADVEGPPASRVRGVRVLFSEPGITADELVRRLVRAEPPGRVVVVVSTDGEIVRGVRAAGAHPVPSQALLRLLSRS